MMVAFQAAEVAGVVLAIMAHFLAPEVMVLQDK